VKISVLLPTRDRLELLKFAVASVLSQRYRDWEIVISDNASTEDVRGLVESLGDERIVLLKQEIARVEQHLALSQAHRSAADELFKRS